MKLLNHTLLYLSGSLLVIITIWAGIFYVNMLDEVHDSIDDGLDNYKGLIIQKAKTDTTILRRNTFDESNYEIREISPAAASVLKETYKDTLMYMENEKDLEPVRILTTAFHQDDNRYFELKVIASMVEEDDLIEDLVYSLIWLYVAIIGSVIVINNLLLKKIWMPFYLLLDQLKGFRLKNESRFKSPETRVKEFKDLNEAVQLLIQNNIEVYNSQKQFIENAAHELQTPLAISINKLELLLEQQQEEVQARTLSGVIENLERLTRLNKSLLLLTKIENKQYLNEEPVDFNELVRKQAENFSDLLHFRELELSIEEKGVFRPSCNHDLAEILVTNLLKNAINHNHKSGRIRVVLSESALTIANTGHNQSLNAQKIFRRFYKSSAQKNNTGLGLAIVKAITEISSMKISYTFDDWHHFSVRIAPAPF